MSAFAFADFCSCFFFEGFFLGVVHNFPDIYRALSQAYSADDKEKQVDQDFKSQDFRRHCAGRQRRRERERERGRERERDIYIYINMYVCVIVCMYVCMYIYIYISRDGHGHRSNGMTTS